MSSVVRFNDYALYISLMILMSVFVLSCLCWLRANPNVLDLVTVLTIGPANVLPCILRDMYMHESIFIEPVKYLLQLSVHN